MVSWEEIKGGLGDYESQWSTLKSLLTGKGLTRDANQIGRMIQAMRQSLDRAVAADAGNRRALTMFSLAKTMTTWRKVDSRIKEFERTT